MYRGTSSEMKNEERDKDGVGSTLDTKTKNQNSLTKITLLDRKA